MFKKEDVIKYIIENIRSKTREEICNFLDIHKKTLTSIMKKNNILDDRIFRYCPECFEKITHIDITNRLRCERQNKKCNKCEGKLRSVRYSGEDNPFYGKSHNESTISILKHNHKGKRYSIKTEFKKGNTNRKDGLSNYNLWLVKFGKEVADQNMDSFKKKLSIANSGENNPMFGKPSPNTGVKMPEERRQKISNALKGKKSWNKGLSKLNNDSLKKMAENILGENNPFYGKQHSDETKEKIKQSRKSSNANLLKAKLDWEKVRQIRKMKEEGLSNRKLGLLFGVSSTTIYLIVHHIMWKEE